MAFPVGTPTVTLVGKVPSAVAGTGYAGLIDCRPSAYLIDSTRHAVYPGGGKVDFASDGTFSIVLLTCDAAGVQPAGWRWHLDLQPTRGQRIQFYANITGTGTVYFDTLVPVPAPGGGPGSGGNGAVSSVNGMIGAVVLDADDVDADPEGTAAAAVSAHAAATDPHGDRAAAAAALASHEADTTSVHGIASTAVLETQTGSQAKADAAQSAATSTAAADATSKVATHSADTTGVHGIADTASLVVTTDPRLSDTRTPTTHAASHAAAGSDPVSLSQSQISGLVAALAALLPKAGGTVTGDLNVDGANLTVTRADDAGAYRLRVTGGGLDFEIGGLDVTVSSWQNADFTGVQSTVMRWEAAGPHLIGRVQFGTSPYDNVHDIDASTGVAAIGKKNSLNNIRFCGRRASTGAPTSGTWSTGDTVQDAAGALWLCTAGGTPGTWVGGGAADPWVFDVTAAGAVGDGQVVADGAMTSGSATLTSATANFQAGDVGKAISVKGAAAAGVTTLVTTISARVSATQVTLATTAAATVTGAVAIWGTDDTAAIQAAVDAAEAYLGTHAYAQVYFPPRPYIVAGPLTAAKNGNGQIVFGVYPTSGVKRILEFRGEGDGAAAVRHWEQTVPQYAGSCLISLGVYSSTSAQIASINNDGNPGVISGPNEGSGYGVAAAFSNMMAVIKNLTILTTHSSYGLTYGAANLWGCANAHLENVGYSTAGTVASPSTDYTSPGVFGTGLSVGLLLPAPGNNDNVVAKNISIGGGYTYAAFVTEHAMVDRYMSLYCWAGMVLVGTYAGSVGSVHAMKVLSASIEACTNELFIMGAGSGGVGPIIDIDQLSTESGAPNITGSSAGAMAAARGIVRLTGLFTESGVAVSDPCGIKVINGQQPFPVRAITASGTVRVIDEVLAVDATAGAVVVTLISAVATPNQYTIKKMDATANTVTVACTGGQTIDGAATKVLTAQWETVTVIPSGGNWLTV